MFEFDKLALLLLLCSLTACSDSTTIFKSEVQDLEQQLGLPSNSEVASRFTPPFTRGSGDGPCTADAQMTVAATQLTVAEVIRFYDSQLASGWQRIDYDNEATGWSRVINRHAHNVALSFKAYYVEDNQLFADIKNRGRRPFSLTITSSSCKDGRPIE